MGETRDVTLKLGTRMDPAAARGMRELAAETKRARTEEEKYQDRLRDRVRALRENKRLQEDLRRLGYGELPVAHKAPGMLSGLAGPGGAAVAGVLAGMRLLQEGLGQSARALNTFQNASLTASQQRRELLEGLPVAGGFLRSAHEFIDALNGTTEAVRRMGAQIALTSSVGGVQAAGASRALGLQYEQVRRVNQAAALRRAASGFVPLTLTGDYGPEGDLLRAHQQALIPARQQEAQARAAVQAAEADLMMARGYRRQAERRHYVVGVDERGRQTTASGGRLEDEAEAARRRFEAARGAMDSGPRAGGGGRLGALGGAAFGPYGSFYEADSEARRRAVVAGAEEVNRRGAQVARERDLQQAITREQQAQAELSRRQVELLRAGVQLRQADVNLLSAQIDRQRSSAQAFGAMSIPERISVVGVSQKVAQNRAAGRGEFEGIYPEEIAQLARAEPAFVRSAQERIGRHSPMLAQVRRNLGLPVGENLDESIKGLEEKRNKQMAEIQKSQMDADAHLAEGVAKAYGDGMREVLQSIIREVRAETRRIVVGLQQRNAGR